MSYLIEISTKKNSFRAILNSSKTSEKLIEILPVTSVFNRWGEEIYIKRIK